MEIEDRLAALEEAQRKLANFAVRAYWQITDRLDLMTLPGRRLNCPICDHTETRERLDHRLSDCIFGGGKLERYVCPSCGCIYGPAKYLELSPEMLASDYELLYAGYSEGDSTLSEIRAFRSLSPVIGRSYLNWGCGRANRSIPLLRAEGFDVWGYEPTGRPGQQFVAAQKTEISAQFAGVFSNNVIEHMVRPVEEFRYLHSILAPGGLMAHASPCYRYAVEFSRFHVIFLTGDAPNVLAERSGFRIASRDEEGEFINCVFERIP